MDTLSARGAIQRIALLGNHVPRQCGIATFTTDLSGALEQAFPELDAMVLAMNDPGKTYDYPSRVKLEVAESDLASYHRAADFLNVNHVRVVSVQHEYGIFGGRAGAHLLTTLRDLRMPIVSTLHTILKAPTPAQKLVMDELCTLSERLVVMSAQGAELLRDVHGVPPRKIDLIPHGTPILPDAHDSKDTLGVQGKFVLLTFGLLSPDKGIEHVIDALPEIVKRHPEVIYVVLGVTHPHIREREGEAYRLMLASRGHRLGVDDNLIFHDRFVSHHELVQFLSAADVYITPYLNAEQITSGTLAFAVGSGKAVLSTPYRYARELLADGRGILVPWKDSGAIATEVIGLLEDPKRRAELEHRAATFGRGMTWPVVARSYMQTFQRAVADHGERASAFKASTVARRQIVLPDVNLAHLRAMTDDTGLLQHAIWTVPRYQDGYCLDDNARALAVAALLEDAGLETAKATRELATRYLAFVQHAFDPSSGRFHNFMSYDRRWTEPHGSDDSHGRAVWALGTLVGRTRDRGRGELGRMLFHAALPAVLELTSPRAWAYTLLGIGEFLRASPNEAPKAKGADAGGVESVAANLCSTLASRLASLFRKTSDRDWPWLEDRLTYANARIPQALLVAGAWMEDSALIATGLDALEWLVTIQSKGGVFAPVGSNGFHERGGRRADFDQQPIEACGMVGACLEAYRATGRRFWMDEARKAFDWFLGRNQVDRWLYDPTTGGCRDGLHPDRPNENQGAESTLAFLLSLAEMRIADSPIDLRPGGASKSLAAIERGKNPITEKQASFSETTS